MRTILTAILVSLVFALSGFAAEEAVESKNPIDIKVDKLADDAKSTAQTTAAYSKGLELWDKELNRVYQELRKLLPEKSFAALKASQVQWLAYRDSQISFINSCYDQYEGTMYIPMRVAAIMSVTRARAIDLKERLEMHKRACSRQRELSQPGTLTKWCFITQFQLLSGSTRSHQ